MRGKLYESEYEEALIDLLQDEGWQYTNGKTIPNRPYREPLLIDELKSSLSARYPKLTSEDLDNIVGKLRHVPGQTHFERLRNTFILVRDSYRYVRNSDGEKFDIKYVDFDEPDKNIFRVVNQLEVGYGMKDDVRIPDVLLYVNGIPLCIFELKNPTKEDATIADAYDQIHVRYMRDIPHLLQYTPLSCISDATANNTRLGTTYTPYEHYYAWKKVNNEDESAQKGIDQVRTIVKGVYEPTRFLEVLRDYVYFPDKNFDGEEEIVCRYPQFFATRMLRESVRKAFDERTSKGGTYFGATGCGKTYTMMFLARQLALRSPELGSPTIIMIVDRDDLQTQAGKLFLRSADFLGLGTAKVIKDREELKTELSLRDSGGFFICTIQKFCEAIGELNIRRNIICFSDEAHRTQIRLSNKLKVVEAKDIEAHVEEITTSTDVDTDSLYIERQEETTPFAVKEINESKIGAFITKPYAEQLRTAFPNATFVGFTGTPIAETIQVFGDIVDRYTMSMAVDDDITKDIKYIPRIAKVTLDSEKVKQIEEYYKKCADEGATEEDIAASKKAMSAMELILGDDDRLERLAADIIAHYTASCDNKPDVIQKGMIVCSKREIGYRLLEKFKKLRPDWFEVRKHPEGLEVPEKKLKDLKPMPTIAMVATRGKNDPKEMYGYLGDKKRIKTLEDAFKQEYSNFRVVIVVDMWITGFDVPCLTYLYNDKPIQKHTLVQTISRVNRKYPGKDFGYIIDYIGIRGNMMEAMKVYGGENFGPSEDDVQQALGVLIVELDLIKKLFVGFDLTPFTDKNAKPLDRLDCLQEAAEHVLTLSKMYNVAKDGAKPKEVDAKTFFLAHIKRLKTAYDICQPSNAMTHEQLALSQCFMCVASYIRKASGVKHDTESMNRAVERMVADALGYNSVANILDSDVEESLFSQGFIDQLNRVKLPATRLEVLIKMLRKSISQYKSTNKLAGEKFEELLKKTIEEYHNRRTKLSSEEASAAQKDAVEEIIRNATQQALAILNQLGEDKDSFRNLGLTFEEKAFYDILLHLRDTHNFEYGEDKKVGSFIINDKCKALAKKVKELIDTKSSFADWLTNTNVRADLNRELFFLLDENGYPPEWSDDVFDQVLDQVEHYKEHKND
ncbi:MAG: HsdR family type I site-specific deoxyribonuclease [Lachnospiraceae bacterium]|nr:HsdR family type I site-specific deoxyribonuclease [Lachnospiraceae bacterium]